MIKPVDALLDKHEARIRELESQDEIHWKTRRTLLAELAAVRADRQDLADRRGEFVERVYALEAALVYSAFAQHSTPQYMLPAGVTLVDANEVRVFVSGEWVCATAELPPIAQSKSQQKRFEAQGVVPFAEETSVDQGFYTCGCQRQMIQDDPPVVRSSCRDHRAIARDAFTSDRGVAK